MKQNVFLLTVLVSAVVLVDLMIVSSTRFAPPMQWPDARSIIILGSALGQIALLGFFLVWGRWNILLRFLAMAVAAAYWAYPAQDIFGVNYKETLAVFLLYGGLVATPAAIARIAGVRTTFGDDENKLPSKRAAARWQFSLWGLLSLMTTVAVLAGIARGLEFPWEAVVFVVVDLLAFCAAAHAPLWTVLYVRSRLLAAVIVVLACPLIGAVPSLIGFPPSEIVPAALTTGIEAAWVAVAVIVVRISRLRLSTGPLAA